MRERRELRGSGSGRLAIGTTAVPVEGPDERIDLGYHVTVVRRHAPAIGACVLLAALLGAVSSLWQPSVYTARATLLLEPRHPHVLNMQAVEPEEVHDELRYIRTQYQMLKSRTLAETVIRDAGFRHEAALGGRPAEADTDWSRIDPALVARYLDGLDVEAVPGTRLMHVTFTSPNPDLARRVATAHARGYVEHGVRQRTESNEAGLSFLRARLAELKRRLEDSEAALNGYRWETGIIDLAGRENVVVEQLDDLIWQHSKAQAERLARAADVYALETHGVDVIPEVIENGVVHELNVHLALAESEHARVASRFKPTYPRVAELASKVASLKRRIAVETARVAGSIRTAHDAARQREESVGARLEELKQQALTLKDESVQYAILQREVETNRQLYESLLQRMKEVAVASELRASNVAVVDEATRPSVASGPRRLRTLLVAGALGLLAGLGFVLGREWLDHSVKRVDEVERHTGVRSLGVVPAMAEVGRLPAEPGGWASPARWLRRTVPALPVAAVALPERPHQVVTDAYGTVRTSLMLSRSDGPPHTVLVASALAGDGKTTTTLNLAAAFARLPANVVVVDGDLRRPSCHRVLGISGRPGLSDVLMGKAALDAVLAPLPSHGLTLLPAGETPPNPTELLGGEEMGTVLAALAERFDFVFIDSPALLGMADATVVSTLVDGVVLVARGHHTTRRALLAGLDRLRFAQAPVTGLVLNGFDEATPGQPAEYPTIDVVLAATSAGRGSRAA